MDLWNIRLGAYEPLDLWPLVRPLAFALDPEWVHDATIRMLRWGLGPKGDEADDPILRCGAFGLSFPNPIGLAAGLDKQASAMDAFMAFGFGAVEVGTVTPRPQIGNPRPRLFRIPEAKALLNRFGFNSVGADVFAARMRKWRSSPHRTTHPVGINLGKNKDSADDAADYILGLEKLAPYADYVTINISSPNTPGLRDLQNRERLTGMLAQIMKARATCAPNLPVLVKVAPDLTEAQQDDIAAVALESGVQGLIVNNTTLTRPSCIPLEVAKEAGGISGEPIRAMSLAMLKSFYQKTQGKIPLIGCGGLATGEDVYQRLRAGASLVQIYTVLVYEGPLAVRRIKRDLAALLRRDGFSSVAQAVGVDARNGADNKAA